MSRMGSSLIALLIAAPVAAGAEVIDLEEIIVSANLTETARGRTGVSVVVADRAQLDQAGDVLLGDFLARQPGISLSATGPFGNSSNLRIRGADKRYVAVYIDGIRVTDPTQTETAFDFGALSTADIDRVEVLKGSQSALYGGSAVAGVVNITTRRATEDGMRQDVAIEAGSYGSAKLSYAYSRRSGPLETAMTLSHVRTDGYSAVLGTSEADGGDATRLSFSARYQLSDALAIGGAAFWQDTYQEYDGYVGFALADQDNVQDRAEAGGRLFAEYAIGNSTHLVEISRYRIARDFDQAGALSSFAGARTTLAYKGQTDLSQALTLIYGAETMLETANYANLPAGRADTRLSGVFAQALWAPSDRLDVSASARVDRNSDFGTFETGRVALAFRPDAATTLRAAVATGFRAPSIDERFGDYPDSGYPFVGNPALTPEESLSFEAGIDRTFGTGATLSATVFDLRIDNLVSYRSCPLDPVTFVCQTGTVSTLENLAGKSVRRGVELSGSVPLGERLTLSGSYTYTHAERPNGARLGLVPRHDLSLGLEAQLSDRMRLGLTVDHLADRLDDFAFATLPDYTVVGARIDYDFGRDTEGYVRIENLFDTEFQTAGGYAGTGRAIHVGLRKSF